LGADGGSSVKTES